MAALCLCSTQAAAQAVLVLSSEAAPYRQAAVEYKRHLEQQGLHVTTVQFAALDDALLQDLLDESPQVVTAIGSEAAISLHRRLPPDVLLTYCMVTDPAAAGLTSPPPAFGVSTDVPLKEQFAIIAEALPHARTLGMLYQGNSQRSSQLVERVRKSLPRNWRLVAISINSHASVADAVNALFRENVDVVWTAADSSVYDAATVRALLLTAVRQKVPVFGFSSGFVRAGAFIGISIDPAEQGKQCAEVTHRLFEATLAQRPQSEQSPRFRIEVNLVVAEMLGLDVPEAIIGRAHQVIRPG